MQGVLNLGDVNGPSSQKKRKAVRACQRCKEFKKRCTLVGDARQCRRCCDNNWQCCFGSESPNGLARSSARSATGKAQYVPNPTLNTRLPRRHVQDPNALSTLPTALWPSDGAVRSDHSLEARPRSASESHGETWQWTNKTPTIQAGLPLRASMDSTNDSGEHVASLLSSPQETGPIGKEYRYATMLSLMESRTSGDDPGTKSPRRAMKLIAGTNPLSALLRKDLKHKIVTNSCSFRTPDLGHNSSPSATRLGFGVHNCDWEARYRIPAVSCARLQYLRAVGCFNLPSSSLCSELLEIFFAYIHPMLPVLDRKTFLLSYYGSDDPPSLLLLQAVFLAASRYTRGHRREEDGVSEIRHHCDDLHTKVTALIDVEMLVDKLCVVQATLIASLHWEGREGLNSATDSLSIAVRVCQELGAHRKLSTPQPSAKGQQGEHEALHRRLWWNTYILDRLTAAQEGTPFLINENDCDVDPLAEEDLSGEDALTTRATLINQSLAGIIEDAVRSLYSPGSEDGRLFTPQGVAVRQQLLQRLDTVASHTQEALLANKSLEMLLERSPSDVTTLHGAIILTHLDTIRILVHRPFILFNEPDSSYSSRDWCRSTSIQIVSRLNALNVYSLLRFSWPFTVYAVVNCLLIFWYDISSPPTIHAPDPHEARERYASVVNLLRIMGDTWWAAAAKHKLAEALARAINMVQGDDTQRHGPATRTTVDRTAGQALTPPVQTEDGDFQMDFWGWPSATDIANEQFWASIGLDFNLDVADNIYSIQ